MLLMSMLAKRIMYGHHDTPFRRMEGCAGGTLTFQSRPTFAPVPDNDDLTGFQPVTRKP